MSKEHRVNVVALIWELGLQDLIDPSKVKGFWFEHTDDEPNLVIEYEEGRK